MYLDDNVIQCIHITDMKFYLFDTTTGNNPVYFENIPSLINHLEGTVQRRFRMNRRTYMQHLVDLGHNPDDPTGKTFVESMSQYFNIGVVKDLRHVKCNVHEVVQYAPYRTEMGD